MHCMECKHAEFDYIEYIGGYKMEYLEGCKKGLEPQYNGEEDCVECGAFCEVDPEEYEKAKSVYQEHLFDMKREMEMEAEE